MQESHILQLLYLFLVVIFSAAFLYSYFMACTYCVSTGQLRQRLRRSRNMLGVCAALFLLYSFSNVLFIFTDSQASTLSNLRIGLLFSCVGLIAVVISMRVLNLNIEALRVMQQSRLQQVRYYHVLQAIIALSVVFMALGWFGA